MEVTELDGKGATARGFGVINILLGRNGSGKSRFLRALDEAYASRDGYYVRYVSPERAGVFKRDGGVLTNIEANPNWLTSTRRTNQAVNFKAASAHLLREIETLYLRRIQDDLNIRFDPSKNFTTDRLDKINRLLTNVAIEQHGSGFEFISRDGSVVKPDDLSSGESECVSLATEIMHFFDIAAGDRFNVLLLDEPDVHLHPDLQGRLAQLIRELVAELGPERESKVAIFIATHSTSLVAALANSSRAYVGTKEFDEVTVDFHRVDERARKVAPFFGHPLSLSLTNDAILIVEGEDDVRVWQQAARSSQGGIRVFPIYADSVDLQTELEHFCDELLRAIYDSPVAYSLRDGDGKGGDLQAIGSVQRFRLACYAIENALLSDEVLAHFGCTWDTFRERASTWVTDNQEHKNRSTIEQVIASADRLRHTKIKDIRQLVCTIAGSRKPWEVVVGQAIAKLTPENLVEGDSALSSYIGANALDKLLRAPAFS